MLMMAILLCSLIAKSQINQVGQILNNTIVDGSGGYNYIVSDKLKLIQLSNGYKYSTLRDSTYYIPGGTSTSQKYISVHGLNGGIEKNITMPNLNWQGWPNPATIIDYYLVSDNLFDSDNEIEFIAMYTAVQVSGSIGIDTTALFLVNENGNIIQSITGDRTQLSAWGINYFSDGSTFSKLLITNNQGILIYDLPGFLPCEACTNTTGINQNQFSNQENGLKVAVAPNPSSGEFNFSYQLPKGKNNAELIINNLNGVSIKSKKINGEFGTTQINLSELSSGIYIYTIFCDGEKSAPQRLLLTK